ncbi:7-deoxyloganetic acid glucosyltransferase-like isoform X2 [Salvia hispanica]|uniref:7-deoxyloganetic acid glucosyltransferase-like isoform X2 n=1 Tax=Salvia hispanica TaxID=49212 RepID=UPI00200937F7|nr:7-deoxyloganetic acid glucosyltransferase-like isoform X2 [Salvia hispanica]
MKEKHNTHPVMDAHVLIFPLPLQGPINSMLKLAELLCLRQINVTVVITQHIQRRLFDSSAIQTYMETNYGGAFRFESIPDGLSEEHPRTIREFSALLASLSAVAPPILQQMVSVREISCIVAEGIFSFASDIADDNLDETIRNAPGMEGIIRRRDLPSLCRGIDLEDPEIKLLLKQAHLMPLSQGIILNTFHQLDSSLLSHMFKLFPNIYAIGPLHTLLQTQTSQNTSSSILPEDRSCISWLDKQPSKSVVYVSIGSLALMTKDQFLEFWYGLVNSGSRFLLVQRPGSVAGLDDGIPEELLEGAGGRGCVVSWAPQQEVLDHRAVGGFLTHCGWNSILESVVAGKPMICWPHHFDQQVNSRYVGEVWKVGLDMKDSCDRVVVEKMVREVMELRKNEFLERARQQSEAARSSVGEGGSSAKDLDRLIDDIKNMKLLPKHH